MPVSAFARRGIAALGLVLGVARSDAGELYRCERPDGRVAYTNDRSVCPGAPAIDPSEDSVQRVEGTEASAASQLRRARAGGAPAAAVGDAAQAAAWRTRKLQAEQELRAATRAAQELDEFVTHCNHGRDLFTVRENGLKSSVSCETVRERRAQLEERRAALERYLDSELEEECRRAGCEPGWLR
jgi:hypothetical protein